MVTVHRQVGGVNLDIFLPRAMCMAREGAVFAGRIVDIGRNTKENLMAQHIHRQHNAPQPERGAATAEYAIATMAAVGFAGLLVVIMRSDEVRQILTDLVRSALTFAG